MQSNFPNNVKNNLGLHLFIKNQGPITTDTLESFNSDWKCNFGLYSDEDCPPDALNHFKFEVFLSTETRESGRTISIPPNTKIKKFVLQKLNEDLNQLFPNQNVLSICSENYSATEEIIEFYVFQLFIIQLIQTAPTDVFLKMEKDISEHYLEEWDHLCTCDESDLAENIEALKMSSIWLSKNPLYIEGVQIESSENTSDTDNSTHIVEIILSNDEAIFIFEIERNNGDNKPLKSLLKNKIKFNDEIEVIGIDFKSKFGLSDDSAHIVLVDYLERWIETDAANELDYIADNITKYGECFDYNL